MASKESKLRELYYHIDALWAALGLAIVILINWYFLFVAKNVEGAFSMLAFILAMTFAETCKNYGVIKRLNERISNLEDQLAQQRS